MSDSKFKPGVVCFVTRPAAENEIFRGRVVTLERRCHKGDATKSREGLTFTATKVDSNLSYWWCSGGIFEYQSDGFSITFHEIPFAEFELSPLPGLENEDEISKPVELDYGITV